MIAATGETQGLLKKQRILERIFLPEWFMKFIADLHIHSHYSRATSRHLNFENLYIAAQLKGITVLGTGDITHPGWFSQAREKLVPAENGLFRLHPDLAAQCDEQVPRRCRGPVRFMLNAEISSIYKKNGRTRKNHNLVFLPDLDSVARFSARLDQIGNIQSDGRPILGLDARDLLEILLETSEDGFLIPAHIWTPWFSMFGSKSGFDSIEECFEDLSSHIFAVETGLSSDPEMNWRVSNLDGLTLVSNSDAHSTMKLGREANRFDTQLDYFSIRSAMETGDPEQFLGTFEFYPEEGKYHADGHRKCNVRLLPEESRKLGGICPECGGKLTLGVLYRVEELADRPRGRGPERRHPYISLIPLVDILAEILRKGPGTKTVGSHYDQALQTLGSEFEILHGLPIDTISTARIPLLAEAVDRMRRGDINISPGFDGEFGRVNIFSDAEREELLGQRSLFGPSAATLNCQPATRSDLKTALSAPATPPPDRVPEPPQPCPAQTDFEESALLGGLNPDQRQAVTHGAGPLIIVAGPGTGKTRTLTHRIAYLIENRTVPPEQILAVTFTNKAAREMTDRLNALISNPCAMPAVGTFHAICLRMIHDSDPEHPVQLIDDWDRQTLVSDAVNSLESTDIDITVSPSTLLEWIVNAKQLILAPDDNLSAVAEADCRVFPRVYRAYQELLAIQGLRDFEDLLAEVVRRLETDESFRQFWQDRFRYLFVDEYQDLNHSQYRMIRALVPSDQPPGNICVIGDPDQSIYGFRGSDVTYFSRFMSDYPDARRIHLTRNYRSTQTVQDASDQVICNHRIRIDGADGSAAADMHLYSGIDGEKTITIIESASEKAEAVAVGRTIERLIGGTGFHSMDFDTVDPSGDTHSLGFSDFAVLFRTGRQADVFAEAFGKAGIPIQIASKEAQYQQDGICELIALLKLVNGSTNYADLEKIRQVFTPGLTKTAFDVFKNWGYKHRFSLDRALSEASRADLPGIKRAGHIQFRDFLVRLSECRELISNLPLDRQLKELVDKTAIGATIRETPETESVLNRLLTVAGSHNGAVRDFFTALTLQTDTDLYVDRSERVTLMTLHAAKGLEFPVVFIAGCENDLIPYRRREDAPADDSEERRLFYVGMTRAERRLYLTHARKRLVFGRQVERNLSPFVADIDTRLKHHERQKVRVRKPDGPRQLELF